MRNKRAIIPIAVLVAGLFGQAQPSLAELNTSASHAPDLQALVDKSIYWYERYRYDLAVQALNKVLLVDPNNAQALRWEGLIDIAKGNAASARVWLDKLQTSHGHNDPNAIELRQIIELDTVKRQRFAELSYRASTENASKSNWPKELKQLFNNPPLGEAALRVYRVLNQDPASRPMIRKRVFALVKQYPNDPRYKKLVNDLNLGVPAPLAPEVDLAQNSEATSSNEEVAKPAQPNTEVISKAVTPEPSASKQRTRAAKRPVEKERPTLAKKTAKQTSPPVPTPTPTPAPLSAFAQGQALSAQADKLAKAGNSGQAKEKLEQAIKLQPDYAWFRYDLASLLAEEPKPESKSRAQQIMQTGLKLNPKDVDMHFASALIESKLNHTQKALDLLDEVPRSEWSSGMSSTEQRLSYGLFLDKLRESENKGDYTLAAKQIANNPRWRAKDEVLQLESTIHERMSPKVQIGYTPSTIAGSQGVSNIHTEEIPVQIDLPIDPNHTLFVRVDSLKAEAGTADPVAATNFGQIGTVAPNSPAVQQNLLQQNFKGYVLGVGLQKENFRADIGTTAGNFPINDWVGGLQWKMDLGEGSLRIDLARRMVLGSVLSTTGAIDPVSGQAWGAARRNGVSAVVYEPINDTTDFVGIGRVNYITGHHIPSNVEFNAQGILSKTVYNKHDQRVELGASLYLWKFNRNLRYYTYGQGGYYSPQAFGSFTIPITWTGRSSKWSWRAQLSLGASESREDDALAYPLDPNLANAALANNNPISIAGGPGGGTSTGLKLFIERQVTPSLIAGASAVIDRSQGYNPDQFSVYLKYSLDDLLKISVPPEGITPYSRF